MRARSKALAALLALLPGLALADDSHPEISRLESAQMLCMLDKAYGTSLNAPDTCRREQARSDFMAGMARKFCGSPRQFCAEARSLATDPARENERINQFMGPSCEVGFKPSMASGLTGELNQDNVKDDATVARMMRDAWGCKNLPGQGPIILHRDGEGRPFFRHEMACDPDKVPFVCGTGQFKPSSGTTEDDGRREAAAAAFRASGAISRVMDGKCVVFSGESQTDAASATPALPPVQQGEDYSHYWERVHSDSLHLSAEQDQAITGRIGACSRSANLALNSSMRLLGHGSDRFRMATRSVVTRETIDKMERAMDAAREGLLDYLAHLTPPAPRAVVEQIERARLFNYRAFLDNASNPSGASREAMAQLEADCRDQTDNAWGHPKSLVKSLRGVKGAATIELCPATIADYLQAGNGENLASAMMPRLLQMLTQTVNPCELGFTAGSAGMTALADNAHCHNPVPTGFTAQEKGQLTEFQGREQRYIACVSGPRPTPPGSAIEMPPETDSELAEQLSRQIHACNPSADTCGLDRMARGGPLQYCGVTWANYQVPSGCAPAAETLGRLRASKFARQGETAFYSSVAAHSLDGALRRLNLPAEDPTPAQKQSDLLVGLTGICFPGANTLSESRTPARGDLELSLFAGERELRQRAGCDALSPAAANPQSAPAEFPASVCEASLQGLPAYPDPGI